MAQPASDMPPYHASACVRGLRDAKRIAMLMAPRLGDTLLMMAMAHNLAVHGREVTVFGDFAYSLRSWLPGMDIRPSLPQEQASVVLADYDCAAQMHVGWPYALHDHATSYFYYDAHVVITGKGFVKLNQISDYCRDALALPLSGTDIGLRPPVSGRHRIHEKRVAVHPSSTGGAALLGATAFRRTGPEATAPGIRAGLHPGATRTGRMDLPDRRGPGYPAVPVAGGRCSLHPRVWLVHW